MEIGSFIELQFPKGKEYYAGEKDIARLNSGRAAILHAFRCTGAETLWLPVYQCDCVREFLQKNGCALKFYRIDERFDPVDLAPAPEIFFALRRRSEKLALLPVDFSFSVC